MPTLTVADCHLLPVGSEVRVVRVSACVTSPTRVGDVWHYWGPSDTGAARFWLPGVRRVGRAAADDWLFELIDANAWPSYPNPHGHT